MAMLNDQKATKMPVPQRPQQRPADKPAAAVNHPAVAAYVSEWNTMAHELDRLRSENHQLKYDLDCARQHISELEHISDHERAKKEAYQRWASRFDTMAGEIAALATTLQKESRQAAEPEPAAAAQIEGQVEAPPTSPEQAEQEIAAAMAKKFAPKTDGYQQP